MAEVDYKAKLLSAVALWQTNELDLSKLNGDASKISGPVAAFEALQSCIYALFNYMPSKADGFSQLEWNDFLKRLYFGVIKETPDYGTTSVSQGVAEMRFRRTGDNHSGIMGFLNGGTGGKFLLIAFDKIIW